MLQKKKKAIILSIIFIVTILTSFVAAEAPYTLRCNEFLWCLSSAHCQGSGWQTGVCTIECEGGGSITCPKNPEWFAE